MSERRERDRTYEDLVRDARSALEAEDDLPAERWVRIRQGIDASTVRSHGLALRWMVAVAAMFALGVWLGPGDRELPEEPAQVAESVAPSVEVVQPAAVRPEAEDRVTEGSRLAAGGTARRWMAFDRHELVLSPGGVVVATRWQPGVTDLLLSRGRVTAHVDELQGDETFQIRTRDAVVRVVGTRFTVQVLSEGGTEVSVQEGTVEVTDEAGHVARVTAGSQGRFGLPETTVEEEPPALRRALRQRTQSAEEPARGLKVIEIEVPPQSAPVPEHMHEVP